VTHFEHVVFKNEVVSPLLFNVCLQCCSHWTIVMQACYSIVDVECTRDEHHPSQEVFKLLPVVLLRVTLLRNL
jgi:hypothetical protein